MCYFDCDSGSQSIEIADSVVEVGLINVVLHFVKCSLIVSERALILGSAELCCLSTSYWVCSASLTASVGKLDLISFLDA